MLGQHVADDVFVDIDAKRACDLQCDARTADTGIAAFELDDTARTPPGRMSLAMVASAAIIVASGCAILSLDQYGQGYRYA
jgi:hypothetical protein